MLDFHSTGNLARARAVAIADDEEMDDFIDDYLRSRNFAVSAENCQIVRDRSLLFAGNPKMYSQLSQFLDFQFGV